jgi:hypothetical protein
MIQPKIVAGSAPALITISLPPRAPKAPVSPRATAVSTSTLAKSSGGQGEHRGSGRKD